MPEETIEETPVEETVEPVVEATTDTLVGTVIAVPTVRPEAPAADPTCVAPGQKEARSGATRTDA